MFSNFIIFAALSKCNTFRLFFYFNTTQHNTCYIKIKETRRCYNGYICRTT
nr:MAG TPA: hypothetical protein [Caudoviricetes sp.]